MTTKLTDDWEEDFDQKWEGQYFINPKGFPKPENIKDFIHQTRTQAYTEGVMKAYESVKGELEYIASRNDTHNAVCIPAAERALSAIKALLS